MGNLIESATWSAGVPYFEADAILTGGPDCPDNIPIQALTNRTVFLKKQIDDAVSGALTVMYANKLKNTRTITMTGDGSWAVAFDASGNVSAAMTLAASGVAAGTYPKVTVDAKGRVTTGTALAASDIPSLDWSKITSGKPTTLAGYGITDALLSTSYTAADVLAKIKTVDGIGSGLDADLLDGQNASYYLSWNNFTGKPTTLSGYGITDAATLAHTHTLALGDGTSQKVSWGSGQRLDIVAGTNVNIVYDDVAKKLTFSTTGVLSGTADTATKWLTARTLSMTGDATWSASIDGSANVSAALTLAASGVVAGTYPKVTVDAKGRVTAGTALAATDIPALDWSKITSGKPTTLDGYGITDAVTMAQLSTATPSGAIAFFAMTTPPSGWLKANGAAISRTTYADLFAILGTKYGAGDGATTFNLPDLRGEFLRGFDDGRGVDTGRVFGSAQSDAMQGHWHNLTTGRNDSTADHAAGSLRGHVGAGYSQNFDAGSGWVRDATTDGVNGTPRTAAETRPRNVALLACIKY